MTTTRGQRAAIVALVILLAVAASVWSSWRAVRDFLLNRDVATAQRGPMEMPVAIKAGVLEVSIIKAPKERFERRDTLTVGGLSLGTTESEVRVDATYRYHVPLDPRGWNVRRVGDTFRVVVPAVQPSLPVAIDTATLQKKTALGWARFNEAESIRALEKSLSAELARRAASPSYLAFQRTAARAAAHEFAVRWILRQEAWKDVKPDQVRVFFADEPIDRLDVWNTQF